MGNRSSRKKAKAADSGEPALDHHMAKKVMKETKLDQKEVDKLFYYFQELASLSGGADKAEEITKPVFIEHCLHLGTAPDAAELFFNLFDVDNSGTIDFTELAMYTALVATGSKEEKIEATFKVFDTDGDGSLSRTEVAQMLSHSVRLANALCMPVANCMQLSEDPEQTDAQVDEVFAEADEDGDGVITLSEFKSVANVNKQLRGVLDFFYYLSNPKLITINQERAKHIRLAKLNALDAIAADTGDFADLDLDPYDAGYDSWDSEDEDENAAALQRADGRYQRILDAYIDRFRAVADAAGADAEQAILSGQDQLKASASPADPIDPILAPDDAARAMRKSSDLSKKAKAKSRSRSDASAASSPSSAKDKSRRSRKSKSKSSKSSKSEKSKKKRKSSSSAQ